MSEDTHGWPPRYGEWDVSTWKPGGHESLGTKPKRWLVEPESGARWLFKEATVGTSKQRQAYRRGEDWSERVACEIARLLGLPVARVELAVVRQLGGTVYGTVCRSVLEETQHLVSGVLLMEERGMQISRYRREEYTVEGIARSLDTVQPPDGVLSSLSAWGVFVGYLVLDALIGNTDRHEENWGAVVSGRTRRLSPTFDHASCLGYMLSDTDRRERLSTRDSNRTPEGFADRARSPYAGRPHPISVVKEAQRLGGRHATRHWLELAQDIDRMAEQIWAIPDHRISTPARDFAERVLRRNWGRLVG